MRRLLMVVLILVSVRCESRAQFSSCPGGVCLPETSSTVRASVRSRTGPGGGGLLGGLGRALLGRRAGGGGFVQGAAYAAPGAFGAAYAAPPTFTMPSAYGAAYAAPQAQAFAMPQTFAEGGSCYSSTAQAPMSAYSAPLMYSAPSRYSAPSPMYLMPQSSADEEAYELVPITRVRVMPSRRRVARVTAPATAKPERRPTAVAVRPARADRPVEELAGRADE